MSKKIQFMREKDINSIHDNMDMIVERARQKEINIVEPILEEYINVKSVIMDYIKSHKRIIYGGHAINALVKNKSPKDAFYKDTDYVDIEFYSNKPIEDLVNICNLLHTKKFKFIQGRSAQHENTYTIFVNFEGYCDISYMPSNLFHAVMTETIDGFKLIHPKFIMVDILRQFNNPIISYWRLEKALKRGKLIISHFPLELSSNPVKFNNLKKPTLELIEHLIPLLTSMKNIMFMGNVAFNVYTNPDINILQQTSIYDNSPITLISSNLKDDVYIIYNLILKFYLDNRKLDQLDKLLLDQYYPFFQFTDKHVDFKLDGDIFLTIYGNNEICIPFNETTLIYNNKSYPIKIGTFNVLFMFYLIQFHIGYQRKDKDIKNLNDYLMYKLLTTRDKFLNSNNKSVIDQTIFEDFKPNCIGIPVSPMRKLMMTRYNRKLMSKSAIQPYSPDDKQKFNSEIYNFENYSGNIINNPRDLLYIKK